MPFSLVILAGCHRSERRLFRFWADQEQSGAFGTGSWTDTSPHVGCCRATFGCCMGTIKKSAIYEISVASERRSSALR